MLSELTGFCTAPPSLKQGVPFPSLSHESIFLEMRSPEDLRYDSKALLTARASVTIPMRHPMTQPCSTVTYREPKP